MIWIILLIILCCLLIFVCGIVVGRRTQKPKIEYWKIKTYKDKKRYYVEIQDSCQRAYFSITKKCFDEMNKGIKND